MQGAYAVAGASLFERFAEAGRLADAFAKRAKATEAEEAELPPADGKARSRADVFATLDHWIAWWRDLLLTLGGAGAEVVDQDAGAGDFAAAGGINRDDAARGITALRDARRDLERNVNPRLALEALMLRLPQRQPAGGRQRAAPATIGREAR